MPVMNGIDAVRKLVESASTAKFHIPHSARRTGFRECLLCCGRHGLCSQGANSGRPCQRDPGSPDGSAVCLTPPQILTPRIEQAHAHYASKIVHKQSSLAFSLPIHRLRRYLPVWQS
jgi:hypothetical protein